MAEADAEKGTSLGYGATEESASMKEAEPAPKEARRYLHMDAPEDAMTYHTHSLASWHSLSVLSMTVWGRRSLWMMTFKLFVFSVVIAAMIMVCVADPVNLDVNSFTKITQFLNTFVSILLGFFMSASVSRWWSCADGFQDIFESIRVLQMQLYGLGVDEAHADKCLRYGVVAAWVLGEQLKVEALEGAAAKQEATNQLWQTLKAGQDVKGKHVPHYHITYIPTDGTVLDPAWISLSKEEFDVVYACKDAPSLIWMWVTSLVGRLAADGAIPPMASGTYCRINAIIQSAHAGMRKVRSTITMQAPFIYVQMLASLVHINNMINAFSFGLTLGSSCGTIFQHISHPQQASVKQAIQDGQLILVSFFFSCFGPFIYQALLEVSIAIAQPFGSKDGSIPTWRMLNNLVSDLHDGKMMIKATDWKQPRFNEKQV